MAYIGKAPVNGFHSKQVISGNGSTTTFSLDYTVADETSLIVSDNAVLLEPKTGYNLATGGTQITFASAPASGQRTYVHFLGQAIVQNLLDVNGAEFVLDANGNTSLTADTDDEIDIKVGGTDRSTIKATGYHNLDSIKFIAGTGDDLQLYHDGTNSYLTNATGALKVATETSGIALTLGHTTSETTVADNLTVTGTTTLTGGVAGNVTATGTVEPAGDTSASDNAAIGYTSGEGLILTGQGSTNDITIKNDADAAVISIPTGTTGVTFAGTVTGGGLLTTGGNIVIPNDGNIGSASDTDSMAISSAGVVTFSQNPVGTLATAAQTNITSLGTLTALTVDDVAVNGKAITMTGSSGDTFTTTVGTNGATTLTTVDTAAAAANITITADGTAELAGTTVTLNSGGGVTLDADNGTITFADAGSSLGTITSSGYSGTSAVATAVTITDNESTNENNAIIFTSGGDLDGGNIGLESDGDLHYNPSTGTLSVTNIVTSGTHTVTNSVTMNASNAVVFEGSTADGNETTLTSVDATADHTISLPNQSGTLPVLAAASTTQITTTPAEINLIDGGTARGTDALATGDGILINDGGTMKMTNVDTVRTYMEADSLPLAGGTMTGNIAHAGNFTLDIDGDIILDANGGDIDFKDDGTQYASFTNSGGNLTIESGTTVAIAMSGADVNIVGVATAATFEPDGDTAAGDNAAIGYTSGEGLILTGQGSTSDITLKNDADATVFTVPTGTDDILFPDGAMAMFGASSDLQIYHDGSNSIVKDNGGGDLKLLGSANVVIGSADAGETYIHCADDGSVTLYHDNVAKLDTNAANVRVTSANLVVKSAGADSRIDMTDSGGTVDGYVYASGLDVGFLDANAQWAIKHDYQTSTSFYINNVIEMLLESDGDLHVDNDVIAFSTTTASDRKLKENIVVIEGALDKIEQLDGVEFNWKKDGKKSAGVIAQDVEKVLPQAVKTVKDLHSDEEYKTVKYDSLHALLIEAIKELTAKVKKLEER